VTAVAIPATTGLENLPLGKLTGPRENIVGEKETHCYVLHQSEGRIEIVLSVYGINQRPPSAHSLSRTKGRS